MVAVAELGRGDARDRGVQADDEASTFFGYSDDEWEALLRTGVEELRGVARRRALTSYSELASTLVERTGLELRAHDLAFPHLLGQIATREVETGGPLLSALCIYKGANEPGEGFYAIARHHRRVPTWPLSRLQKEKVWIAEVSAAHRLYGTVSS